MTSSEHETGSRVRVGTPLGVVVEAFRNPGFVVCVALLAVFAIGFEALSYYKNIRFRKEALPLKLPLNELAQQKLKRAGYELVRPYTLESNMVDQLGTEEYIHWLIRDASAGGGKERERLLSLFVTYYTGKPGQVPHVPEICHAGSGHNLVKQTSDEVMISAFGQEVTVPIQLLHFERQGLLGQGTIIVLYTFHANGQFRRDRQAVRLAVGDPFSRYAYHSKVEVSVDINSPVWSPAAEIEAGKRLLEVALSILVEDHWPDWESAVRRSDGPGDAGGATGGAAGDAELTG